MGLSSPRWRLTAYVLNYCRFEEAFATFRLAKVQTLFENAFVVETWRF